MEIHIDTLKERPRQLDFEDPSGNFPVLAELANQGIAEFHGLVTARLTATLVDDLVEVDGMVNCTVVQPCSRCLQSVEQALALKVELSFIRQQPGEEEAAERELSEADVGLIAFDGECIDLRSALEQEMLMALPQHPLCRDDCAGLCPVCGGDLNQERCDCSPPVFHGGLAVLKNFKVVDKA